MKKLESSTDKSTGNEDAVFKVPVVAEDSAFVDSCEYVVQLDTEFPAELPPIDEEGSAADSPVDPDLTVRKAA